MSDLRALSFVIDNVEGIAHAKLDLGKPTPGKGALYLLEGRNGEGKSSLLHGITALSAASHDPSVIRDGSDVASVRMTYWDGQFAAEVSREISQIAKGDLIVKGDGDGVPTKQLETWIKKMMGTGFGSNPLDFLCPNGKKADAKKRKERIDYLMQVLEIEFTLSEVRAALNGADNQLVATDRPKAPKLDLAAVNKLVRDLIAVRGPLVTRRDDAVAASEKWRIALAGRGVETDHKAELRRLEGEQATIRKDEADEVDLIQRQLRTRRGELAANKTKADGSATLLWQSFLDSARAGSETAVPQVVKLGEALKELSVCAAAITTTEEAARKAVEKSRADHATQLQALAGQVATAQAGIESQIQTEMLRTSMAEEQQKAANLSATWELVDFAVKNLEALKKSKLDDMPETLRGLTIDSETDEVMIDGRAFDKWNRGEQYIWAARIGSVGTGELNLLLMDEAEALDDDNLEKFRKGIVKAGLIVIMARRSAGPLRSDPPNVLTLVA